MHDVPLAMAVHGGAGDIRPERLGDERRAAAERALAAALAAGRAVLEDGGAALDAVVAAVAVLEDDPVFNAGRGSVLTADATVELDAAVMDGPTRRAGAVAAVARVRNPVRAARLVMERTTHVLLAGPAAERWAAAAGCELCDDAWFVTEHRRRALERLRGSGGPERVELDHDHHGTVGAVARDRRGGCAAATSTGGLTNKLPGRVGDTPLLGAGTWADERCAVSCTGRGEVFMRLATAKDLADRLRWAGQELAVAADAALAEVLALGGDGGLIAVDAAGRLVAPFVSRGMYRGWWTAGHEAQVALGH